MNTSTFTENPALAELMNHDGGIDDDMAGQCFHTPELMKGLVTAMIHKQVIWEDGRIHIEPTLFFAMCKGVAF